MRPEDAAAREIPIPQPAAAAVERGIDAAADRFVDHVGFPRPGRLPVEGKAEDQHDEAGGGRKRDGERGQRAPGRERAPRGCTTANCPNGGLSMRTVASARPPSGSVISIDPGAGAEGGQRLVGPSRSIRRRPMVASWRASRPHHALGVGEHETPARRRRPGRQHVREHLLRPRNRVAGS